MKASTQERVALLIVGAAALGVAFRVFGRVGADPLSRWLLKRGHVKWAMRVRALMSK